MNFKKLNLILGWLSFAIALAVYLLTLEPTVSLWDCGEFIASSYKLQVGHPPGAPLFLIIGRVFSLFASDTAKVAMMINAVSAFASAFTILFLFWTISHLLKKILMKTGNEVSQSDMIVVLGASFVGAMAYTFSDTFWFSAVEGEVYATSSLFTAVVFWAILKWENVADEPGSQPVAHPDCLPDRALHRGAPPEPAGHTGHRPGVLLPEIYPKVTRNGAC
jgi:hypothetical protein